MIKKIEINSKSGILDGLTSNFKEGVSTLLGLGALSSDKIILVLISLYHSLTLALLLSTCLESNVFGVVVGVIES